MAITRTPIVDDDGSGTTGTVLDNAWKQQLYDQIDAAFTASASRITLLGHGSGLTQNPASENFAGYIGTPGLQPYDTILAEIELHWNPITANAIPINLFWIQTASPLLVALHTFGNPSGGVSITRHYLRRQGTTDGLMHVLSEGGGPAGIVVTQMPTIDGWSKNWAVTMQHQGVPAGGFLYWKWSVTLIAG